MIRASRTAAWIVATWLATLILWIAPGITRPDGVGYFEYLPSVLLGHDLLFFDEWARFGMIAPDGTILHKEVTSTGHLGNHWTVGSAIAWSPAYLTADLATRVSGAPRDGMSLRYNVPVIVFSAIAGLMTLLLSAAAVRLVAPELPESGVLAATLFGWIGTPLLFYCTRNAITAHAWSSFSAALVVLLTLRLRERPERWLFFSLGLALGFAFDVRPQNAALVLFPLLLLRAPVQREESRRTPARGALAAWLVVAAGALVAVLPQLVASWFLYGNLYGFLGVGGGATPFAAFQRIWWWEPIFSWYHGLLWWTPLAIAGVAGLALMSRREPRIAAAALSVFAAEWFVNATLERSFWGAYSFGQRRFDSCIPLFIIGLSELYRSRRRKPALTISACAATWTMLLFFAAGARIDLNRYYTASQTAAAALIAPSRVLEYFQPLIFVRPGKRIEVLLLMSMALLLFIALVGIFALLKGTRQRCLAFCAYALLTAGALMWAGSNDESRASRYEELVSRNRMLQRRPGGADVRLGLLRDELDYLERSGQMTLAGETRRELAALEAARRESGRSQ